jgi:hypothetical protein
MVELNTLYELFGSTEEFVRDLQNVMTYRPPFFVKIEPTWAQEILIQVASQFVIDTGPEGFTGFQSYDSEEPFYIDMHNALFIRARVSLLYLNSKVLDRLSP